MKPHCPACNADFSPTDSVRLLRYGLPWYKYSSRYNHYECRKCGVHVKPVAPEISKWIKILKLTIMITSIVMLCLIGVFAGINYFYNKLYGQISEKLFAIFLALIGVSTFFEVISPQNDRNKWTWIRI